MKRALLFLVVGLVVSLAADDVGGVIITSGNGTTGNTTAPADDFGWANVGNRGIYLGNQWVLTVFHVGAGPINLDGSTYQPSGLEQRLKNPNSSGLSEFTDLLMYRIDQDPGLPMLQLPISTPSPGLQVSMAGDGLDRESTETHWDGSFTETSPPGVFSGYKWASTATKRWGENILTDAPVTVDAGFGDVISLETTFDSNGLTHEAQATTGDSGGGVFVKNGVQWELIGLIHAVSVFKDPDQPDNTSVYLNKTFSADLATYRTQIESIKAIPEPSAFLLLLLILPVAAGKRSYRLFVPSANSHQMPMA